MRIRIVHPDAVVAAVGNVIKRPPKGNSKLVHRVITIKETHPNRTGSQEFHSLTHGLISAHASTLHAVTRIMNAHVGAVQRR